MTWEDVIIMARKMPEFQEIIFQSYLESSLLSNLERFNGSEEFSETIRFIESNLHSSDLKLLDIGSGNGISAVSFALRGYQVTSVEPDSSETVGRGAINNLVAQLGINLNSISGFGEKLPFQSGAFDLVYMRQTLHHASDINVFLAECFRVLKPGGMIFTVRDHVIYSRKDKVLFLKSHPFHKYYGGENAYSLKDYKSAFNNAGFHIRTTLRHYDSVINFFPLSIDEYVHYPSKMKYIIKEKLIRRIGFLGKFYFPQLAYRLYSGHFPSWYNEKLIPGRLYSFIAFKK
jgi:ubiquinone/menaquinone biosynthesis C-methylase UbiE